MKSSIYVPKHRHVAAALALLLADCLFFTMTNPNQVPSALLIVGFVLVALSIYGLLRGFLAMLVFYGLPLGGHERRLALYIGLAVALGVALQSLGELSPRDIVVLSLLSVIAYVYTSYGRGKPQPK